MSGGIFGGSVFGGTTLIEGWRNPKTLATLIVGAYIISTVYDQFSIINESVGTDLMPGTPRLAQPATTSTGLLEGSITIEQPQPYSLRNVSQVRDMKNPLYEKQFSDMSCCMDFKCNKDISQCDNMLPTSFNDPNGPCCTHILRDMLHIVDNSMANLGLDYFVGFGTLLGLIRSGRVIPWTIDNDIVVDRKTFSVMTELWNIETTGLAFISDTTGRRPVPRMCATPRFAGGKLQQFRIPNLQNVPFLDRGYPYIDFYFGQDMPDYKGQRTYGKEYMKTGQICIHWHSDIFPTKRMWAYNGQFALSFPHRPVKLLQRYYGLNWRTPLNDDSEHGNPHQICDVNYGLEDAPRTWV